MRLLSKNVRDDKSGKAPKPAMLVEGVGRPEAPIV